MTKIISGLDLYKVWTRLAGVVSPFASHRMAAPADGFRPSDVEFSTPDDGESPKRPSAKREKKKEESELERADDFGRMLINLGRGAASIIFKEVDDSGARAFPDCPNPNSTSSDDVFRLWGSRLYQKAKKEYGDPEAAVQEKFLYYLKSGHRFSKGEKGAKTADQAINYMGSDISRSSQSMSRRENKLRRRTDLEKAMSGYANILWKLQGIAEGKAGVKWQERDAANKKRWEKILKDNDVDLGSIEPRRTTSDSDRARSLDEEFGTMEEGGGPASGGEGSVPQPLTSIFDEESSTPLEHARSPSEKAELGELEGALKPIFNEFYKKLPEDQKILFDIIMEEEEGGLFETGKISDQTNMKQQTLFKERCERAGRQDILSRFSNKNYFNEKVRKPLRASLQNFVNNEISMEDWETLHDTWLSGLSTSDRRRFQERSLYSEHDFMKGQEERKLQKALEKLEGSTDPDDHRKAEELRTKLADWDEYGKLLYVKSTRKLMPKEKSRMLSLSFKPYISDRVESIGPISHDLGVQDEYAEYKWLKANSMAMDWTEEVDDRYYELEDILTAPPYDFSEEVLYSIKPKRVRGDVKRRASTVIAARIAGFIGARNSFRDLIW